MTALRKTVCRVDVTITGGGFDVREADPVAAVTLDAPGGEQQLARFVGMCVVSMLTEQSPVWIEAFSTVCRGTCSNLVTSPSPSEWSIADARRPENPGLVLMEEMDRYRFSGGPRGFMPLAALTIAFPRVGGPPKTTGKTVRFRAELREPRGRVRLRLGVRNPLLRAMWFLGSPGAPLGRATMVLCILEHVAHTQPRDTTYRVAKVCKRLLDLREENFGDDTRLTRKQEAVMYRLAGKLAEAEEPLSTSVSL